MILDPTGAPRITDPVVDTASGTLAKGTYYYKVAAVLDSGNPHTAGESLPTEEAVATLAANGNVALSWTAPAVGSVLHYRVYRSATPDAASGSEVLLKDNVAGLAYTDTGADAPGTEPPNALGATGLDSAATIATDPAGVRHLYVVGDDGATRDNPFIAGATSLTYSRMRHGAAEMSAANGPPNFVTSASATTAFLISGGGRGINRAAKTSEYALVTEGGSLTSWAVPSNGLANQRDGTQLMVSSGYAYALAGGTAPSYSATNDQSPAAIVTTTTLSFPSNWANAGSNLPTAFGRHGAAAESAFFYVAGGTTNDTDALSTVYQVLH